MIKPAVMINTHQSTLVILAAMEEELSVLLPEVRIDSENSSTWQGRLYGNKVIIRLTGIGKVNAAMTAQRLISEYKVSRLYNFGVAGGISAKVVIGDIVCATRTAQSDFDLTILGLKKGQMWETRKRFLPAVYDKKSVLSLQKKYPIKFGTVVSADQFVADRKAVLQIGREFKALAKDMEAAAINQVCHANKIHFTAVKGICDGSGESAGDEYKQHLQSAVAGSTRVLLELIKNYRSRQ